MVADCSQDITDSTLQMKPNILRQDETDLRGEGRKSVWGKELEKGEVESITACAPQRVCPVNRVPVFLHYQGHWVTFQGTDKQNSSQHVL